MKKIKSIVALVLCGCLLVNSGMTASAQQKSWSVYIVKSAPTSSNKYTSSVDMTEKATKIYIDVAKYTNVKTGELSFKTNYTTLQTGSLTKAGQIVSITVPKNTPLKVIITLSSIRNDNISSSGTCSR